MKPNPSEPSVVPRLILVGWIGFLCVVGIRYGFVSSSDDYGLDPAGPRGYGAAAMDERDSAPAASRPLDDATQMPSLERRLFVDRTAPDSGSAAGLTDLKESLRSFHFRAMASSGEPVTAGRAVVEQTGSRLAEGPIGGNGVVTFLCDKARTEAVEIRLVTSLGRLVGRIESLPPQLADESTDLGDVMFHDDFGRASGVVYDGHGRPTRFAAVRVVAAAFGAETVPSPDQAAGVEIDGPLADGLFVVYAASDFVAAELCALTDGRTVGPVTLIRAGERGVRLDAGRAFGSITGEVLCDGPVPRDVLVSVTSGSDGAAPVVVTSDVASDGSFTVAFVPEGKVTLRVLLGGWHSDKFETVRTLEDVMVYAGERAQDPRLSPIDLRGAIVAATVRATGPDGMPVEDFFVEVRGKTLKSEAGAVLVTGKAFPLVVYVDPVDRGLRPARVELSGDTTVALRPCLQIRLKISPSAAAEVERLRLVPSAEAVNARRRIVDPWIRPPELANLEKAGVIYLDEPGEYEIRWFGAMNWIFSDARYDRPRDSTKILVRDIEGVQEFAVAPSAAELAYFELAPRVPEEKR